MIVRDAGQHSGARFRAPDTGRPVPKNRDDVKANSESGGPKWATCQVGKIPHLAGGTNVPPEHRRASPWRASSSGDSCSARPAGYTGGMARRHFKANMFVLASGRLVAASATEQAGQRGVGEHGRTVRGVAAEPCGDSYLVERQYHRPVIEAAQRRAAERDLAAGINTRVAVAAIVSMMPDSPWFAIADAAREQGRGDLADRLVEEMAANGITAAP